MDKEMIIRDYLLDKMIRHEFSESAKLPSENELADQFNTTRNKIRKVYDSLEAMGYLYSKHGVGRFKMTKKPEIELQLRGDVGFSTKMREMAIPYESVNLGMKLVDEVKTAELNQKGLTGRVFEIARLRIIYDKPSAIHRSFVSESRFPDIEQQGDQITSMFKYYHKHNYNQFTTSGTTMSISFPTLAEMDVLECGSLVPLLILETDCWDEVTGSLLEVTHIVYRSDLFKYRLNG